MTIDAYPAAEDVAPSKLDFASDQRQLQNDDDDLFEGSESAYYGWGGGRGWGGRGYGRGWGGGYGGGWGHRGGYYGGGWGRRGWGGYYG